jgi:protein-S-isoprenylcysteine O-methyltransferase Ste14
MESPSPRAHLKSILALPFMVILIIPCILYYAISHISWNPISGINNTTSTYIGLFALIIGFPFFLSSIWLFNKIGKGTLAPWNPTKKLVVKGLYRHVRNPMITGVVLILISEAFILENTLIFLWGTLFFCVNFIYFVVKEEPDLIERFGVEYKTYKKNVPRWIPRIRGWRPEDE